MKESTMWRNLAKVHSNLPVDPNREFICIDLNFRLRGYGMLNRIESHIADSVYFSEYCPDDKSGRTLDSGPENHARVLFCLLMELECQDEGKKAFATQWGAF